MCDIEIRRYIEIEEDTVQKLIQILKDLKITLETKTTLLNCHVISIHRKGSVKAGYLRHK